MKRVWMVLALVAGCEKNKPADTPPAATRPAVDAAPKSEAVVMVEPALVVVDGYKVQDIDGAIDRAKLDTLLTSRRGELVIGIAPDATYQRLIDVMDVAVQRGLAPLIDIPGQGTNDPGPPVIAQPVDDEPILVLTLTTDSIILGQDVVAMDDLREAIAKNPRKKLALQADRNTRGEVLIRAIASAKAAGIPDVLFIVRTAPPVAAPRKREAGER